MHDNFAEYPNSPELSWKTENFTIDNATIILTWIQGTGVLYDINVVPNPLKSRVNGNTNHLTIVYNTTYTVTLIATLCGQNTDTTVINITVNQSGELF